MTTITITAAGLAARCTAGSPPMFVRYDVQGYGSTFLPLLFAELSTDDDPDTAVTVAYDAPDPTSYTDGEYASIYTAVPVDHYFTVVVVAD